MADYRVGMVLNPTVPLAAAVAASSAFPPVLSPAKLALSPAEVTSPAGTDLNRPPFTEEALLTDGGVYDNLGLETAYKRYGTILASDGLAPRLGPLASILQVVPRTHALRRDLYIGRPRPYLGRQLVITPRLAFVRRSERAAVRRLHPR